MTNEKDVYWYESPEEVIIGLRGGPEYKMNRNEFMKMYLRNECKIYNMQSKQVDYKAVIRLMIIESQYVEFEEVQHKQLLLK